MSQQLKNQVQRNLRDFLGEELFESILISNTRDKYIEKG
jgi:hypothetical protein